MSRRQLFHASDLARALKVAQQAGLTIARIEIESSGKIVVVTGPTAVDDGPEEARRALDALRRRNAERRAECLVREDQAGEKPGARRLKVDQKDGG